jgi:Spy/CpxP family protein refolding chaperone
MSFAQDVSKRARQCMTAACIGGLGVLPLIGALAAPAFAQGGATTTTAPGQPRGGPGGPSGNSDNRSERRQAREHLRQQAIEQMQTMRMWRITQELKLDQATAAKVFPLLAKMDEQERELARGRMDTFRALRQELDAPAPDNKRVNGFIDQMIAQRTRRAAFENERLTALRKVLSPVQHAKMMMLLPRIEEGFRQRIRESMRGRRGHFDEDGFSVPSDRGPPR